MGCAASEMSEMASPSTVPGGVRPGSGAGPVASKPSLAGLPHVLTPYEAARAAQSSGKSAAPSASPLSPGGDASMDNIFGLDVAAVATVVDLSGGAVVAKPRAHSASTVGSVSPARSPSPSLPADAEAGGAGPQPDAGMDLDSVFGVETAVQPGADGDAEPSPEEAAAAAQALLEEAAWVRNTALHAAARMLALASVFPDSADSSSPHALLHSRLKEAARQQAADITAEGELRAAALEARARELLAKVGGQSASPPTGTAPAISATPAPARGVAMSAPAVFAKSSAAAQGGPGVASPPAPAPAAAPAPAPAPAAAAAAAAEVAVTKAAVRDARAAWEALRAKIEVPDRVVVKDVIEQFTRLAAASVREGRPKSIGGFVAPMVPTRGATGREAYLKPARP
jgi:hypothetical protein